MPVNSIHAAEAPPTLTRRLVSLIQRQILDGVYAPGSRLPSIREMAKTHDCAKNTIVNVFDDLTALGVVEPRRGSGFFVCAAAPAIRDEDETSSLSRAMDVVWLMREQLKSDPEHLRLGDGFPPVDWLTEVRLDKFHQKVVRTGMGALFGYGSRFGYQPLRQHLAHKLANHGIEAATNQIVLTHGANQALDIVIRNFVKPGDRVLVDEPGYYMLFGKLKLSGARIVGIPRLADGPDLDVLEQELKSGKPCLFFTQTLAHNPTGSDTSPHKAHKILQLADRYNAIIVENDSLADFKPHAAPRIATLDQLRRTIYVGSFSKSVSAALRVGFLACHRDLASDLADIKMLVHVSSSEYCERTLDVILSEGHFSRHAARLRDRLTHATEQARRLLEQMGAQLFCTPGQSMYLWAAMPGYPDSKALAQALMRQNIVTAPGSIFHIDTEAPSSWSRYNVGLLGDPRFAVAMQGLLR